MTRLFTISCIAGAVLAAAGCGMIGDSASGNQSGSVPVYQDAQTALSEGDKYLDSNRISAAIEAYKQAVTLDPDMADAHFQLGVALALLESDTKEAAKEDINANVSTKAVKTESQKAFEAAIEAYKKRISAKSEDAVAHFNLGRSYSKLDKDSDAERALREALRLSPEENEYRITLADVLMKLAKYGEAAGLYRKAFEVDPENFDLEDKIEEAVAGRKRQTFTGPSPSPSPSPGDGEDSTGGGGVKKGEGNQ
jgi:tetratricopeptide (TPR) repeat protein